MLSLKTIVANSALTELVTAADAGSGSAKISLYSGTMPVDADTALSGNTLLAQLTCSKPCATVANKVMTFASITDDSAVDATGTATFFRLTDSDDNLVLQGTVSGTSGSGDMKLSSTSLVLGGTVHIASATIQLP